jgi:hypothetical protein
VELAQISAKTERFAVMAIVQFHVSKISPIAMAIVWICKAIKITAVHVTMPAKEMNAVYKVSAKSLALPDKRSVQINA